LLNASDAALTNPVTVPAGGTLEIKVKVTADALALTRARDASISTSGGRQRFAEGGGYVTLTSTGTDPALRVPVHIAARPASSMSIAESSITLPSAFRGTFSLTPSGTPVDTVDDTSLVTILELMGVDPNEASSSGPQDAADLRYIGATSDYPTYPFTDPNPDNLTASMYFGVATYGKWDTPNSVEFDVYIDVNEDGTDDYIVFNTNSGFFSGTTSDTMYSVFCPLPYNPNTCDAWNYVNGLSGTYNTNLFNNNVMTLVVPFQGIGLVEGVNTDFDFYVVSYSREAPGAVDVSDIMSYDVAKQAFTAVSAYGMPMWDDALAYSPTFDITYDKAVMAANNPMGLLLLHHHNTSGSSAEIFSSFVYTYNPFFYFLPLIAR